MNVLEIFQSFLNELAHVSTAASLGKFLGKRLRTNEDWRVNAVCGASPDVDSVSYLSPRLSDFLGGHRGYLHSFPISFFLGGALNTLPYLLSDKRGVGRKILLKKCLIGSILTLSHVTIDLGSGGSTMIVPCHTFHPGYCLEESYLDVVYHSALSLASLLYFFDRYEDVRRCVKVPYTFLKKIVTRFFRKNVKCNTL